jgi:hypothetical protein
MAARGVHFSLDAAQVAALKAVAAAERVDFVQETFEEELWSADRSRGEETDKAWDAIHRALTDGELGWDNGSYPLNHAILGGKLLSEEEDYILSLKSVEAVRDVAMALKGVTQEQLRAGYDQMDPESYGMPLSDEDFEYTWAYFQGLVTFYERAAGKGLAVLFTVDQ